MKSGLCLSVLLGLLVLLPALNGAGAQPQQEEFTVVVGYGLTPEQAAGLLKNFQAKGVLARVIKSETETAVKFRLCVGTYPNRSQADSARLQLTQLAQVPTAWVLRLKGAPVAPVVAAQTPIKKDTAVAVVPVANPTPLLDGISEKSTGAVLLAKPLPKQLSATELETFQEAYANLVQALARQDYLTVNSYLHPNTGLYVLFKPASSPVLVRQLWVISQLWDLFYFTDEARSSALMQDIQAYASRVPTPGDLPTYTCPQGYVQQGYVEGALLETDKLLHKSYLGMKKAAVDLPLTPEEERNLLTVEEGLRMGVKLTDAHELKGMDFSLQEGRWYLTVLELVYPCGE